MQHWHAVLNPGQEDPRPCLQTVIVGDFELQEVTALAHARFTVELTLRSERGELDERDRIHVTGLAWPHVLDTD